MDDGDDDLASSPHVARGLARERLRAMASRMRPRDVARAVEAVEEDDSTWARFIAGRGDVATRGSAMRARAALHDAHARALDSMTASTSRETYRTLEEDAEDYGARAAAGRRRDERDACLAEIPDARARERDEETTEATRAVSTSTTSRAKKRPKTNGTTFRGGNRELKDLLTFATTAPPTTTRARPRTAR